MFEMQTGVIFKRKQELFLDEVLLTNVFYEVVNILPFQLKPV